VRVARIGRVTAIVYVRTLYPSMPRCAHGRRTRRASDAVESPPTLRHGKFPPLRATPTGEDAALQGESQSTSKAGLRIGRSSSSPSLRTSNGSYGHTSPVASSALDSAGHAVLHAGRVLSRPSRARAAASVPPATVAGWHRQLRISSTASYPRCLSGNGWFRCQSGSEDSLLTGPRPWRPWRGSFSARSNGCSALSDSSAKQRAAHVEMMPRRLLGQARAPSPSFTGSDRR